MNKEDIKFLVCWVGAVSILIGSIGYMWEMGDQTITMDTAYAISGTEAFLREINGKETFDYSYRPNFLVKEYNVSEMSKIINMGTVEVECLKLNDVTNYYITRPIKVTPEELKQYKKVNAICGSECDAGNGKIIPEIYKKDGRYYIFAQTVAEYKNKNDCNIYKEYTTRLYPIFAVEVNSNEGCIVYK